MLKHDNFGLLREVKVSFLSVGCLKLDTVDGFFYIKDIVINDNQMQTQV